MVLKTLSPADAAGGPAPRSDTGSPRYSRGKLTEWSRQEARASEERPEVSRSKKRLRKTKVQQLHAPRLPARRGLHPEPRPRCLGPREKRARPGKVLRLKAPGRRVKCWCKLKAPGRRVKVLVQKNARQADGCKGRWTDKNYRPMDDWTGVPNDPGISAGIVPAMFLFCVRV